MKRVLMTLSVALILTGTLVAQQETAPDVYPDKSPVTQQQQQTAKKQQPARKAVVAKKPAAKATLVAAKTPVKAPVARSN